MKSNKKQYDVATGSDITSGFKIDKPLVVYIFCYEVIISVA